MLSVDIVGRLLGSLFLIVGALGLIAYLGKRSHRTARSLMRVHTRMSIAKGVSVAIVEVGERFLLVGIGEKGVNLLAELDPSELPVPEETKEERTTPRFLEALMSSALQRLSGNSSWRPLGKSLQPAASSSVGGLDAASLQQFMSQSLNDGPRTGFVTRLRQRTLRTRLRGPSDAAQN